MRVDDFTHVVLHEDSGEPVAVVSGVDELEDGRQFGLVRWLHGTMEPTYLWLHGLSVLPISNAAPDLRSQVTAALTGVAT